MKKTVRWALTAAAVAAVAIQLVPVTRTNPSPRTVVAVPPEVHQVLQRACYDCHSNDTRWPWYSRVAPVSWLVAHDVSEGREHLNFSVWPQISTAQRAKAKHEIAEALSEGEMPPWLYLPAHPDAKLTAEELSLLRGWAAASEARLR
jgi:hypothetical protein